MVQQHDHHSNFAQKFLVFHGRTGICLKIKEFNKIISNASDNDVTFEVHYFIAFFFCTTWDWQNCFSQILVSSCARGRQKEQRFNFNIVSSRWFVSGIVCVCMKCGWFFMFYWSLWWFLITFAATAIQLWHLEMKGKGLKIVWRNFWGVQNCEYHIRWTDWWP